MDARAAPLGSCAQWLRLRGAFPRSVRFGVLTSRGRLFVHPTPRTDPRNPLLSRRGFIAFAGGLGGAALLGMSAQPATAAPTPTLPGEYYRKANQVTPAGTVFDNICVRINGDVARLHVPQTVKPNSGVPVEVVWFYHGAGSDHNALDGGFKSSAAAVVDRGAIAICQTAGGTQYANATAVALQRAGYSYMSGLFPIYSNVLRATSGGGALACETYGAALIPNITGMYNVNAVYDMRALYEAGGNGALTVVAAYGNDLAAIEAGNPARHPTAAWTGSRVRVIVSTPNSSDRTVPPEDHGLALISRAQPVAAEASVRTHTTGHNTPSFATADFVDALKRWSPAPPLPGDRTPPKVAFTAPTSGSTVSGFATVTVTATDDVGVTDVGLYIGAKRMFTLTQQSATQWGARIWTKTSATPNGTYTATARAADAAGNVGVSAPITVTIKN